MPHSDKLILDQLRQLVGVVETGFFLDYATKIFVAGQDGVESWEVSQG